MSRLVNRPIEVTLRGEQPHVLKDGNTHMIVSEIIDQWAEAGAWWNGEPSRHVFRVQTAEDYVYDIECAAEKWSIYRVWD